MSDLRKAAQVAAVVAATVVTPALAQSSGNSVPTPPAAAQHSEVSDATVHRVGAALHQTVAIRQKYAARLQSMTPEQQQQLTQQAETEMQNAIGDQGLTVQEYNQVMKLAQADPSLKQRLRSVAQSGD